MYVYVSERFGKNKKNIGYVNGDLSEDILDGFQPVNIPITGAREYAAGIGNDAIIRVGNAATIEIIPRNSFDVVS